MNSLKAILALIALFSSAQSQPAAKAEEGNVHHVVILHTNDIHGHLTSWKGWEGELKGKTIGGFDRLAGAIAQARKESQGEVLLLDAGDLIGDSMLADLTEGQALIKALNHLGYDALTVGNHEPDFGMDTLRKRCEEAKFPVLAANLVSKEGSLFTKPYLIKKVNGVTVGILGLAYPKTDRTTAKKNVAQVVFQDPAPAVKQFLPKMREDGAEVIVILSHLGLGGDKNLAQAVEGIDVIVGGHSHNRMEDAKRVGQTLIVQAGAHASDLGRLDLTIKDGKITQHHRTLVLLDHAKVPSDPVAKKLLEEWLHPHRKALDEVVGEAQGWLIRAQTLAGQSARKRDEESPIDSLFADILRAETKADIALLPGVGYGVAIPPGTITAAQLRQLVPHEGKVVTMQLSGAQVAEVLEQALENVFTDDPQVKVGGMVQVSGLRFQYDPARPKGQRVWRIEGTEDRWEEHAKYDIVTNSMMAEGGHHYQTLTKGENRQDRGSQYEMLREWFRRHSPIATPPLGRIQKATKPNP